MCYKLSKGKQYICGGLFSDRRETAADDSEETSHMISVTIYSAENMCQQEFGSTHSLPLVHACGDKEENTVFQLSCITVRTGNTKKWDEPYGKLCWWNDLIHQDSHETELITSVNV